MWEKGGYFTPKIDHHKKPFTIFLVSPNASGPMHVGNMLMVAIQDVLARYQRMQGKPTLYLPSTDQGGYETQITFERELNLQGKTRFDFTRKELFQLIKEFVEKNNVTIRNQIKAMGASVDWSKFHFAMDDYSMKLIYQTFHKMIQDDLIYRGRYMVNYCPECGTTLADIELSEKKDTTPLYHIRYPIPVDGTHSYLLVTTTHPETIFSETDIVINPQDERINYLIGKKLTNPITGKLMHILEDTRKEMKETCTIYLSSFSPSYDPNDYTFASTNTLHTENLIDWEGKMLGMYQGLTSSEARQKAVELLQEKKLIDRIDSENNTTTFLCKRGHTIQHAIFLNWFLKVDASHKSLKKPVYDAVKNEDMIIYPRWKERSYLKWITSMRDWPIARQNVWGIRIPVWYELADPKNFIVWFVDEKGNKLHGNLELLLKSHPLEEIKKGLERVYADEGVNWVLEKDKEAGKEYLPETDTFDTWFSVGHWQISLLGSKNPSEIDYFYPISLMETGWDILNMYVSRFVMLAYYTTGKLPFPYVYLHRLALGKGGKKMSKSMGNVVYPEPYIEKFGSDPLRMALISHTHDQENFVFEEGKIVQYASFGDNLWDLGKFITVLLGFTTQQIPQYSSALQDQLQYPEKRILADLEKLIGDVTNLLDKNQFAYAQEKSVRFLWNINGYINAIKNNRNNKVSLSVLRYTYLIYLKLLHPFMPFMTEAIYGEFVKNDMPLIISSWPII